jgi:hypothetical protein
LVLIFSMVIVDGSVLVRIYGHEYNERTCRILNKSLELGRRNEKFDANLHDAVEVVHTKLPNIRESIPL